MPVPHSVAERLATASRALRVSSLQREVQNQTLAASDMTPAEIEEARERASGYQQFILRRLSAAIAECDLVAAEEQLQLALSHAARVKGCTQALMPQPLAA